MNKSVSTAALLLIVSLSTALAESPFERELAELTEQRNKAVAAATEPIQKRYVEALEQLLRRATQNNDLDTAVKIKAQLQQNSDAAPAAAPPSSPAVSSLHGSLTGSAWSYTETQGDDKAPARVTFQKDTVLIDSNRYSWAVVDGSTIAIEKVGTMTFDKSRRSYVLERKEGRRFGKRK